MDKCNFAQTNIMKKIFQSGLTVIAMSVILPFTSCSKDRIDSPNCDTVCLLSDKYTSDSVYLRTDTLWKDDNICGEDLIRLSKLQESWIVLCADMSIERWRYVVGNKVTQPKRLV